MKEALHESEQNNPTKASVESVLPGVHLQFANLNNEIGCVHVGLLMRFGLGLMVWWKECQLPMVSVTLCFKFASKMTNEDFVQT